MSNHRRLRAAVTMILMTLLLAGCAVPPAATSLDGTAGEPAAQALPPAPDTSGPSLDAEQTDPAEPSGDAQRGRAIFESGGEKYTEQFYCSRCHSLDGADGYGPTMQGIAALAAERVPGISPEEYIHQSILEPDAFIVPGYRENMGLIHSRLLSQQEVEDLVAFLLTQ